MGTLEKELGIKLLNPNGKPMPTNKKLSTIRNEQEQQKPKRTPKPKIKANPKVSKSLANKARKAVKEVLKKNK